MAPGSWWATWIGQILSPKDLMSKRNIGFSKPEDPAFLKRIKQQIGYREGPGVEAKRQAVENLSSDDEATLDDQEAPQVVVLKEGDLTAEQAEIEKKRLEKGKRHFFRLLVGSLIFCCWNFQRKLRKRLISVNGLSLRASQRRLRHPRKSQRKRKNPNQRPPPRS